MFWLSRNRFVRSGDDAGGDGEVVLLGRLVDLAEERTGLDADGPAIGVDVDGVHGSLVDEQAVVARREAGEAVTAAADGHGHVDGGLDVARVRTTGDEAGPAVDRAVPDRAVLVVAVVAGKDHLSPGTSLGCGVRPPRRLRLACWSCPSCPPSHPGSRWQRVPRRRAIRLDGSRRVGTVRVVRLCGRRTKASPPTLGARRFHHCVGGSGGRHGAPHLV
jgi:hypothetical protein